MLQKGHQKMLRGGESATDRNHLEQEVNAAQDRRVSNTSTPGHGCVPQARGLERKLNRKLIQSQLGLPLEAPKEPLCVAEPVSATAVRQSSPGGPARRCPGERWAADPRLPPAQRGRGGAGRQLEAFSCPWGGSGAGSGRKFGKEGTERGGNGCSQHPRRHGRRPPGSSLRRGLFLALNKWGDPQGKATAFSLIGTEENDNRIHGTWSHAGKNFLTVQ